MNIYEARAVLAEVGSWSREKEARLQIDHRKVEQLHPRVTDEQIGALAEMRKLLQKSGDDISTMLDGLGIR